MVLVSIQKGQKEVQEGGSARFQAVHHEVGEGIARFLSPDSWAPALSPQRIKYLLTPREPNRWAVEQEGATPFAAHPAANGILMQPTHIVVETMM